MKKLLQNVDPITKKNVDLWLNSPIEEETKKEIRSLLNDPKQLEDAFYQNLSFGTGGLRGLMGVGTNRMNIYTVRFATQGLANYIHLQKTEKKFSVAISYDSRINSFTFAKEAAKVLAGNGIEVYIFQDLRPTPLLSFAVRFHKCIAGIMVTASHNPAIYNGYKVYWEDGAQVLPPHDTGIIQEVEKIRDFEAVSLIDNLDHPFIHWMKEEVDNAYIDANFSLQNYPEENLNEGNKISIAYTSLHGTGITIAPKILKSWGFSNVSYPKDQIIPDGKFPTVHFPNPEYEEAMELGIKELKKQSADVLIATDPDADRIGVAVIHVGEVHLLNGNQLLCLCLEHVLKAKENNKTLPKKAAFVKTIVTTELFQTICDHYKKPCFNVLTGFKYIAEKIRTWEEEKSFQYIFGGEESYGSLLGTFVRDKDAMIATALVAEIVLHGKKQGKTLIDLLYDLYSSYGFYHEEMKTINFPETKEGKEKIKKVLTFLRTTPLEKVVDKKILFSEDYETHERIDHKTKKKEKISLPSSNVLAYYLEDHTKLIVRPSGTEPKVKIYCGTTEKVEKNLGFTLKKAEQKAKKYTQFLEQILQQ